MTIVQSTTAATTREIPYTCLRCGQTEILKNRLDEAVPPVANCSNCGSGRETADIRENIRRDQGMRPMTVEDLAAHLQH